MKLNSLTKAILFICITFVGNTLSSIDPLMAQSNQGDEIEVYLEFSHRGVINKAIVISYYKDDTFYLPINELFRLLQFDIVVEGLTVNGNFSTDQIPYSFNFERQNIQFDGDTFSLTADDFLLKEIDYYVPLWVFDQIFGLRFTVDFSYLLLNLNTEVEIPIIEQELRSQSRRISGRQSLEESFYPLKYPKENRFLNGGFLDYSLTYVTTSEINSFNYNTSMGLQLAGGDVQGTLFGNYTDEMNSFQTNDLRWRYIFRNQPIITSVVIGQSNLDGAISNPYTGIRISNTPIEVRRYFDEFEIEGQTIPQSEVELYLNNSLIDFQESDQTGNYRFLAPITYGNSQLDLRIYGPTGQIIERSSRIQVPFTLLPKGEINYSVNAGQLDNNIIGTTEKSMAFQANASVGISSWLTSKFGIEYYENAMINNRPAFTSVLSSRVGYNYIVSLEAVTDAYYRGTLNAIYPNSSSLVVDYTNFSSTTGIYNTSGTEQQLITSFFQPLSLFNNYFSIRLFSANRWRIGNTYTTSRIDLNTRVKSLSFKLSYYDQNINSFNPFEFSNSSEFESSLTYSFSRRRNMPNILKNVFLRGQVRYSPFFKELQSVEGLISRDIFRSGQFQISFGQNFITNSPSLRFNFIIDLKKIRSNSTVSSIDNDYTITQNVRGSVGYDSNNRNLILTSRDQVGRSGTAIKMFVDNNGNGRFDEEDSRIDEGRIRIDRGGASAIEKNGILYYTNMQAYFQYNMEMNSSSISNPMLVAEENEFSIITDPNSFKNVEIPFFMAGVIDGKVERVYGEENVDGLGGARVFLYSKKDDTRKELRTFNDGGFYEYPLPPGEYEIWVDQDQLDFLGVVSKPEKIEFEVKAIPEGDFIEGLKFSLIPVNQNAEDDSVNATRMLTLNEVGEEIKTSPEVLEYSQEIYANIDEALRLIIKAQNAFYGKNLDLAFSFVSQSLELFETAQGYALKGSFYYFEGNTEQAQRHWQMALRFNPDLFIPNMELLEERVTTSSSED